MEHTKKKFSIYNQNVVGYVFIMPWLVGFLCFTLVPFLMSFVLSFTNFNILSPDTKFIGLDNYVKLFTQDKLFIKSLKVTFKFAFISVPLRLIFALLVAMILNRKSRAVPVYRVVYYLPSIIGGSVAVAILWRRMFESTGTVNAMLGKLLPFLKGYNWFSEGPAIWVLIILTVWQFGSSMLIFLSALKQIPRELYEAAHVDGVNGRQRFFKVTLPLLTPTIFFNLVQQTINSFLAFTQCKLITNGDPRKSTLFYTVYPYNKAFPAVGKSQMGYASALAWIMLVIITVVTALLFWSRSKWVYDD